MRTHPNSARSQRSAISDCAPVEQTNSSLTNFGQFRPTPTTAPPTRAQTVSTSTPSLPVGALRCTTDRRTERSPKRELEECGHECVSELPRGRRLLDISASARAITHTSLPRRPDHGFLELTVSW
jgi:hypothetical protein